MDPWSLFAEGEYEAAVEAYSLQIAERPTPPSYNNRATALLLLGQWDKALADFAVAGCLDRASGRPSDHSLLHAGAVLWIQGRERLAAGLWRHAVDEMRRGRFVYTDAAGGVQCAALLWFASAQLGDAALRKVAEKWLAKRAVAAEARAWPGPLAGFLLGEVPLADLEAWPPATGVLHSRQQAQVQFYAGARALAEKDAERAAQHFRQAAQLSDAVLEIEHHLGIHEDRRTG